MASRRAKNDGKVKPTRVSLACRNLDLLDPSLAVKLSHVRELDLSNNSLTDVKSLEAAQQLESIVLDSNLVSSHTKWPKLASLHTLWVNKNQIKNLTIFMDHLSEAFPNLHYLSMLNNEACPNFFNGGTLKQYNDYRYYVICRLPNLKILDSTPVTDKERELAQNLYSEGSYDVISSPESHEQESRPETINAHTPSSVAPNTAKTAPIKPKKRILKKNTARPSTDTQASDIVESVGIRETNQQTSEKQRSSSESAPLPTLFKTAPAAEDIPAARAIEGLVPMMPTLSMDELKGALPRTKQAQRGFSYIPVKKTPSEPQVTREATVGARPANAQRQVRNQQQQQPQTSLLPVVDDEDWTDDDEEEFGIPPPPPASVPSFSAPGAHSLQGPLPELPGISDEWSDDD